ncbi:MAG: hypothetical protein J6O51_10680 [Bacteroidales bacterium]|nr:hypothetical protein [Bacteroidales bacterium]
MDIQRLNSFESTLQDGLLKLCRSAGFCGDTLLSSPDLEGRWAAFAKDYIADAVENFNSYPEAAIAWAAFLGMGVAHDWDTDWDNCKDKPYKSYYGPRGWDDMDEYILGPYLHLQPVFSKKLSDTMDSCALAAMGLMRHEGIETWSKDGFYALARIYGTMFRIGACCELHRLGYKMSPVPEIISN